MRAARFVVAMALSLVATPAFAQDKPTEPVFLGTISVVDVSISVDGEQVRAVTPGRPARITLTLRNDGEEPANDATLRLDVPPDAATAEPQRAPLGDIGQGETAKASFDLEITKLACFDPFGVGGLVTSSAGEHPVKFLVPADCPGARLAIIDVRYEGGDGDDVPEPGEELAVSVIVRNDGKDGARDLRGALTVTKGDVRIVDGTARWPDIGPGKEAESDEPFRIAIAKDADTAEGCGVGDGGVRDGDVVDGDVPVSSDDGSVASDGTTSSDGTVTSDGGGTSGEPDGTEPGSAGGAPPSQGEDPTEPGTIKPEPPQTIEPDPAQTVEPVPMPEPTVEPEPAPLPDPAAFDLRLVVTGGDGATLDTGFGTGPFCVMEDAATGGQDAAAKRDAGGGGGLAGSIVVLLALVVGAVRRTIAA